MENSERDGNTRPSDLSLEKPIMKVREQQLELDMEQQTDSKKEKEYVKVVYCYPAYLLICRVHHEKRLAGRSTSWNQDCWEK